MIDDLSPQDSPFDASLVFPVSSDDLEKIKIQSDEYLAGWKRAQADYANVLRERDRDRAEYVKYANTSLLLSILPVIEHFSLAMRHVPDTNALSEEQRKPWETWLVGLRAVHTLWEQAAQAAGLERIEGVEGSFDPMLHEAMGREESETVPVDHIVRVLQDGWKLHGKVLRPAQVIVAEAVHPECAF